MSKLRTYINSLSTAKQIEFATACNTTMGYIRKAISIQQKMGAELCASIERATNGKITRRDLRPDDWMLIWPELTNQPSQSGQSTPSFLAPNQEMPKCI
ncbi:Uncharacterized protein MCB1EB_1484 [Mycoavidus cysteinexigens]|uniref:Uncharacterized protein n=1 Tax=Mycoavidus cysteinexigens TaxID=1553431 RepID=A0A2Z6EX18_9BURK|nr:YdaS family helix-turn-helix protein [Mycoavidus cysteinexigens]BBE09645.1 Uncharacterized protein MCB1EB_1484 [Mycoavidus cysteinexigens]GLR01775.1 hypothetical protein GCM10007934_15870 [Mycoavidus cysteinexigens]